MPTGYTADIAKDITFEEFILKCARAFGACITMKDDDSGDEIPQKFEPSTYHLNELERYKEKLIECNSITVEDAEKRALAEHKKRVEDNIVYDNERKKLKTQYSEMLDQVQLWLPPTKDHVRLKEFMIDQIEESIRFDCTSSYGGPSRLLSGEEWLESRIESIADSIEYHAKAYAAEVKRVATGNLWLAQLRNSIV